MNARALCPLVGIFAGARTRPANIRPPSVGRFCADVSRLTEFAIIGFGGEGWVVMDNQGIPVNSSDPL